MEIESKFTTGPNATSHPNPHSAWSVAFPFFLFLISPSLRNMAGIQPDSNAERMLVFQDKGSCGGRGSGQ